jgi:hypothetical protein
MAYVPAQMVSAVPNPALDALIASIAPELVFGQVLVQRTPEGFQINHVEDRNSAEPQPVTLSLLREIAQFTRAKQFRPLKSAPTLQSGWKFMARSASELNDALQCLYPGAVADWFAARQPSPPITSYRQFAGRQTGMYRVTAMLDDEQVAQVARAGCQRQFCLKRRLWGAKSLPPDEAEQKSLIPCLEPCAVLLEFARAAVRIEQREKYSVPLAMEEIETCVLALERLAMARRDDLREADFSVAENPRRAQWLAEKLRAASGKK